MMDKNYILENGLLERYVMADLSQEERLELEKAFIQFPELQHDLNEMEHYFEQLSIENGMEAPEFLRTDILDQIKRKTPQKVVALKTTNRRYLWIAASIALGLLLSTVYMFSELGQTKKQLQIVEQENEQLNSDLELLNKELSGAKVWFDMMIDPSTDRYVLNGNDLMPDAALVSYVNTSTKSVVVNTTSLPVLDAEHDYQMWADVEGEMINMGIIDTTQELLAMTYIDHAESLNITIEPAGGSEHPTVSQLISNVYLN